ncbi:unnamed protein product [Closterium sp. NIES-53]
MHSRLLVSGLPRSLPPLPPSPTPPCLPCVEGRQSAAPHSSFPPTTAPLQTLHMDVWGPTRISGQGRERYFLLVVDDYTRYTTVFPLCSKGEVFVVLIRWIRTVRLQLRERFGQDLPVLRLHSERGGEFSSDLLRDSFCGEGILQSFTLPDSPQQNGIVEYRIGLVMEVARTSMIHAAAPHFLWPFAVWYAAHQLNLWPRVSLPETSPTLRWTGKVGDASVFRVCGSRAFVRDTSADKLSARAIPCVFLGFVPDAPGWQFYHPTSRRDVTFDESVPFYSLFPYRSAPSPPPPLFLAPGPPPVAVVLGAAPGAASGGAASGGAEPGGAGSDGAGSGGAEPEGVEPGGAESEGAEPGGAESEGAESGGAEPRGVASSGGPAGASPRLSSQQLREWLVQRPHRRSGAPWAGEPGDARAGGAAVTTGAGDPTEPKAAGAGGAGAGVAGVGGPGAVGAGAAGAGAVDPGAGGAGGTVRPRPYFVPLLQQVLGVPSSTGLPPPFLCPPPDQSQPPLQPASPLPVPSPYAEQSGGLTERREPASRPISPVRTARRAPRLRPPPVPGTHTMALRPSSVPLRVPLPAPPGSSLPESAAASALVAERLDFAVLCCLDYASALVAESVPASPPSVGGECALGTDVLEDRQEDFECLAATVPWFASLLLAPKGDPDAPDIPTPRSYTEVITGPYSSQWQAAMDAEMASWKSTSTYVDEVPPPGVNIVDGMWIFRCDYKLHSLDFSTAFLQGSLHEEIWLRRPPGFTGSFPTGTQWSLRRPVYDLRQVTREWHDTLRTTLAALGFVPSTADPSLFLRTGTSLPPFYVLVYVDDLVFATADTEALTLAKSELQKRHTCTDLGELRSYLGLHITWDRARRTITLTQSHIVHQVLQRFGFQFSSPQLTPLSTSHSLSAPPSDESVEPSVPYPELVGCLMYLMTCTRPELAYPLSLLARYVAPGRHRKVHLDAAKRVLHYLCSTSGMGLVLGGRGPVVLTGHTDASWVDDSATQRSSQGSTFSLGSGSVSWRSTRSSSVLSSSCEAEIYAGAMAAQELRWLTYLLTDLGEQPRSPPVLYQRGQLRLVYVATRANTANVFTKALQSALLCFASSLDWSCDHCLLWLSPTSPMGEDFECLAAAVPCFASMLLALEGEPDAPDIQTPRSYAEAITGPYSSQWQAAMDAEMTSWKSTGTYIDEVPLPGTNIVDGMWIFRRVDYFHTFSPTPKMTTLRVLLHVTAHRDYELHSLDFSTAFLQGSLHEEIWLRRPPSFTGTTLAALGFAPSTADPSLFLRTGTSVPPFYILVYVLQRFGFQFSSPQPTPLSTGHSLSAPHSDESVEPSGLYPELVGCLMYLMTCTRPDLAYPLSLLARYVAPGRHRKVHWDAAKRVLRYLCSTSGMGLVLGGRGPVVLTGHTDASWADDSATQRSSQGYTFNLGSGSVSWRSTRSSSVLSSSCEAEIYAGAMAAQELRWLTYLLADLGEQPRSPPILYVDNKAMIALCQEHRLEHRTKHIALRYFLARELQQRGQLRLVYVANRANTADIFTKALPPGDHQCFSTVLGLVPTLPHLLIA